MKRITPEAAYEGKPCSVVAVGCALNASQYDSTNALESPLLHADGYLSIDGMNRLIRANMPVIRRVNYKRGQRPKLRDWAHTHPGTKAIICVTGHFIYFDGRDYYSFFWNGSDEVISVWEIK